MIFCFRMFLFWTKLCVSLLKPNFSYLGYFLILRKLNLAVFYTNPKDFGVQRSRTYVFRRRYHFLPILMFCPFSQCYTFRTYRCIWERTVGAYEILLSVIARTSHHCKKVKWMTTTFYPCLLCSFSFFKNCLNNFKKERKKLLAPTSVPPFCRPPPWAAPPPSSSPSLPATNTISLLKFVKINLIQSSVANTVFFYGKVVIFPKVCP